MHAESTVRMDLPLYGLNDAPKRWFRKFVKVAREAGLQQSRLGPCLFFCRGSTGALEGLLVIHVDDAVTGGAGERYENTLRFDGPSEIKTK